LTQLSLGVKKDIEKVDQLFLEDLFDPRDKVLPSLDQLLAIPLEDKLQKKKRQVKGMTRPCVFSMYSILNHL